MKKILKLVWNAIKAVRLEQARARLIEELDERTLRDIGLEAEANRARSRTRLALRFGDY
jgi:hypothetical protein